MEWNCFSNFGKGAKEEHLCEIILKLAKWFRKRCHLKKLLMTNDGRGMTDDGGQTQGNYNSSGEPKKYLYISKGLINAYVMSLCCFF